MLGLLAGFFVSAGEQAGLEVLEGELQAQLLSEEKHSNLRCHWRKYFYDILNTNSNFLSMDKVKSLAVKPIRQNVAS